MNAAKQNRAPSLPAIAALAGLEPSTHGTGGATGARDRQVGVRVIIGEGVVQMVHDRTDTFLVVLVRVLDASVRAERPV